MEEESGLDNRELWDVVSEGAEQAARIVTERADYAWSDADPIEYQWEFGAEDGEGLMRQRRVILDNFGTEDMPLDDAASFVGHLRELLLLIISDYFDTVRFFDEDDNVIASYAQDGDGKWRKEQADEC